MKIMKKIWVLFFVLCTSTFFFSCEKEKSNPEQEQASTTPKITGVDGALWAVKAMSEVNTAIGGVSFEIGTAVAFFSNSGTFTDVGEVKVEGSALKKLDNNSYVFTPSLTDPKGVSFSSYPEWTVEGKNGFPAVQYKVSKRFPRGSGFSASETLDKSKNYTISFTNVVYADSILLNIHSLTKTVAGSQRTITFTANELSALPSGAAVVNAALYNYKIVNNGGKKLVFGNQMNFSKPITIN